MNLDETKEKFLGWWCKNASPSTKIINWLQKYKMPIFVATAVMLFFNFASKPKVSASNAVVKALLDWWHIGAIIVGVILLVRLLVYLYKRGILSWNTTTTTVLVAPKPSTPVAPTPNVTVQRASNSALWAIFFLLLGVVVWFYVLPLYPDIKTSEVFEKVSQHEDFFKKYGVYGIAILAGLFSYFFGGKGLYKRPLRALLVAFVVAGCVYYYLHPEALKATVNSFIDTDPKRPIISKEMGTILLIFGIIVLLFTGNVLALILFFLVLFFYYSYTCFGV